MYFLFNYSNLQKRDNEYFIILSEEYYVNITPIRKREKERKKKSKIPFNLN